MTAGSSTLRWIGLALLGLVIAAGIAFAASKVVSQRVGLAGESFSAGAELAPPQRTNDHGGGAPRPHSTDPSRTTTQVTPPAVTAIPPPAVTTAPPPAATTISPTRSSGDENSGRSSQPRHQPGDD